MSARKRPRHEGGPSIFHDVLEMHITSPGCIQYCEDPADGIDKKALHANQALLVALRKLQPNMSFLQKTLEAALLDLAKRRGWSDEYTFAEKVAKRIRCMCRHVYQAISKKKIPAWVCSFFPEDDGSTPTLEVSSNTPPSGPAADPGYIVGWDSEQQAAWRRERTSKLKEWTRKITPGPEPHSPCTATWPDNYTHEVSEC